MEETKVEDNLATDFLECKICMSLAREAVETNCCHQIFCSSCLIDYNSSGPDKPCPMCRNPSIKFSLAHLAMRMIGSLPQSCPYECGHKTSRSEMEQHLLKCKLRRYHCALLSCQFSGNRDQFIKHFADMHSDCIINDYTTEGKQNAIQKTLNNIKTEEIKKFYRFSPGLETLTYDWITG